MRPRFLMPSLLLCFATQSFAIVDATSTTNTSDPGGGVPWANVGSVNGGTGEYLGNGWVLTAYHVGAGEIGLDSGTFQTDGRTIRLTNPAYPNPLDPTVTQFTDILLFHLILNPSLASLPIVTSTPSTSSTLEMVGFGHIRGSAEKAFGSYTGFDWSASRFKSYGTNKRLPTVGTQNDLGYGTLQVFAMNFSQSPQTTHEAQVATGDSGGAVFQNTGTTGNPNWQLAGMIDALASYVYPQSASVYGDYSYIADLATYRSQINTLVATTAGGANWNGASGSTWAIAGNWSSSPVPGTSNINTATFNSAGGAVDTISLDSGVTINTVLFDTASAAAYTIGSGAVGSQTLTLKNGGAITTSSTVSNGQLFNAALTLGDDATAQTYTISNNTAPSANPSLTLAGSIAGATGGTAGTKTLAVVGAGHTAISGGIGTGGAASLTVNKSGSGTLDLSGTQTYATLATSGGATNINSAIGTGTSSVSVAGNGTTLKFGSVSQKLASLTIGAGATVTFTSGTASFTAPDDTKALSFGGGPPAAGVVPEPGTTGLLLLGALSVLSSRRKRSR